MFLFKRKLKELQVQNSQEFASAIESLKQEVAAIETRPDAAERYLALTAIDDKIQAFWDSGHKDIDQQVKEETRTSRNMLNLGGAVIAVSAVAFAAGPLMVVGALSGVIIQGSSLYILQSLPQYSAIVGKDIEKFYQDLNTVSGSVAAEKTKLLENHLVEISSSKQFGDICEKFPAVAVEFAKVAARTGLDVPGIVKLNKPAAPKQ